MAILSKDVREQVRSLLAERLQDEVTLTYFTQLPSKLVIPGRRECEYCTETQQLYEELTGLSDKLKLVVHDITKEPSDIGPTDVPLTVLSGHNRGVLRYWGIPSGYEFSTLLEDIIALSTGETSLSEKTKEALAGLEEDIHLQVFVTPT